MSFAEELISLLSSQEKNTKGFQSHPLSYNFKQEAKIISSTANDLNLENTIILNHFYNSRLWVYEDKARYPKANDQEIAQVKRVIDTLNQKRNDAIELINKELSPRLPRPNSQAPLFSESIGMVIDRLSILKLKVNFYGDQQTEVGRERLSNLLIMKTNLIDALNNMLHKLELGEYRAFDFFQYKTYNDKNLNPYLKS